MSFPLNTFAILLSLLIVASAVSQEQPQDDDDPAGYINWKMPTMGGLQFWTDVRCVGGWKIQRKATTDHFRLIDSSTMRIAWGNQAHCDQELNERICNGTVQPDTGKVVIAVHGLGRTSASLTEMAQYLHEHGGYTVIQFQYASSRDTVETHAEDLGTVIEGLGPEVTEINFVGHSLGNIVVRCYLGNALRNGFPRDPRITRMVMLGPPNQGSRMALVLKNSFLYKTIAGASGSQLGIGWELLLPKLATPDFEFGIIAGGQDDAGDLNNFVLRGADDLTVSLNEAKLAGATDLMVRPLFHGTMMNQPEVLASTLTFLQQGYFSTEATREPIAADWHR